VWEKKIVKHTKLRRHACGVLTLKHKINQHVALVKFTSAVAVEFPHQWHYYYITANTSNPSDLEKRLPLSQAVSGANTDFSPVGLS